MNAEDRIAQLEKEPQQARQDQKPSAVSEAHLNLLNKYVQDVLWILRLSDLRLTYLSPSVEQLTGYTQEEALNLDLSALFAPKSLEIVIRAITEELNHKGEAGVDSKRSRTIEAEHIHKDGSLVPTELAASILRDAQGEPELVLGVTRDITQRRLFEKKLQTEKNFSQALLQASPAFYVAINPEGKIMLANQTMIEALGYEEEELTGKDYLASMVPERQHQTMSALFEQLVNSEGPTVNENHIIKKDGTEILVEWHGRSVADEQGRLDYFFGVGIDITERKQAELEHARLEEQVHQAQKMESIGRLAGGIAHDFNNLLTVINSYAGFAAEDLREGDPLKADLRQIQEAGQRAAALTRQLLAFSRKQVLEARVLDLNEVVFDLEKLLRRLIGEDIELSTSLAADLGRITADPGQIEQVVMNLAVNAKDAMTGGGRLCIETANVELDEDYANQHADTTAGPYVMLTATDDGVGMSAEVMERIFEPFFTTRGKNQGTGLGLSTVYGIVKQSGGCIRVESELDQGTTFKVYLPRVETEKSEPQQAPTVSDLRGDETILVVEDEKAVRTLTRRILTSAGYLVITAANGGEALLECERHENKIHLVLTDVVMPKMSGKELSDRLAKIYPDLKVLFMSGYTDNAIVQHGVLDEGTHFIAKPFNSTDLLKKIKMVIGSK